MTTRPSKNDVPPPWATNRSFTLRLVGAATVVTLLVIGLVAMVLRIGETQHRHEAASRAESLSAVLRSNLDGAIAKVDLTLLAVADDIARQRRAGGIDAAMLEETLRRHDSRLPEALGLRVVDRDGIIRYGVSGIRIAQVSIADRPQFRKVRDDPKAGLVISKPVFGRAAETWMITLSRRLEEPDGSFAGVVHVAMPLDRLTASFAAADVGTHGVVSLWDEDLTLITRIPQPPGGFGSDAQPPTPSEMLRGLIEARTARAGYLAASGVDGVHRSFFITRLSQVPLWVNVGLAEEDFLADWRRQARVITITAAVLCLAVWVIALLAHRSRVNRQHSEAALRAAHVEAQDARRRLELILASAGDGICGIDGEGRLTFINPAGRRILGWGEDERLGVDLHAETHHHRADGSEYPSLACPVRQTLYDGNRRHIPRDLYWRRDGTSVPVEVTVAPIILDGRIDGAVALFRDISRRLRIEAEAARNAAMNAALGDILRRSLDDRPLPEILEASLADILGLPGLNLEDRGCVFLSTGEGDILQMAASRNLPAGVRTECARLPLGKCLCGTAAATAQMVFAAHVDGHHRDIPEPTPDHGHYCVPIMNGAEVLGVLNAYVAAGHRRMPVEERFLKMAADTLAGIIRRKRMEQTLKDGEELAKALLNASNDGALLLDMDFRILAVNEALAARFGKIPEDMVGRNIVDDLPPNLAEARTAQLSRVIATGEPLMTEDERDGIALENRLYPVRDANGALVRIAVFSRDVTRRRDAQKTIEKALADLGRSNAELEQFAYVASHDLREPLRAVTGHLQLMQRLLGDRLDPDAAESLGFAVDGAKRMDALIRDLLEYSRIGHADRRMDRLELGEVMTEALANLSAAVADAGAEVRVDGALPPAHGNRMELTRLFQNLIGNALKYRAPDRTPEIRVTARRDGDLWDIAVKDNGIGIEPQYFDRIFMIFQRLHGRGQYEGTGIGLAVCRKIVDRHGGRIRVESTPGEGSTFTVSLPALAE